MERFTSLTICAAAAALAGVLLIYSPADSAPPDMTRDEIICRGQSGVGNSYWWGGECWCRNGCSRDTSCDTGVCHRTGSSGCPDECYHTGSHGADCSGFVSKCWQVPNAVSTEACGAARMVASDFHYEHSWWNIISRSSLRRGDAMASTHHVVLFEARTGSGGYTVYEAMGCYTPGIVHQTRSSMSSDFTAATRINVTDCACDPGATDSGSCGNCGHHSRTCRSDCQWGDWSSCDGQGECAAGSTDSRDCCDCGTQRRTCSSSCAWGDWGGCSGADPDGGATVCDTEEPGPCAEGRVRCVEGCIDCVRIYDPVPEICDDVDNDCTGVTDDGYPQTMGTPPPPYAAELRDVSFPSLIVPGENEAVWAEFVNVGTETWQPGDVWIAASSSADGDASLFYDETTWRSWDIPAVIDEEVPVGGMVHLSFDIAAPAEAAGIVEETFVLQGPDGDSIKCPSPAFLMSVIVGGAGEDADASTSPPGGNFEGGCTCASAF